MTRSGRMIAGILLGITLAASTATVYADDQDVIDYRQHVMKTMGEQAAAMAMILQQKAPPQALAIHAKILAVTAATAKKAFETKVAGGEAKPDVWASWADFAKRLDTLTAATDDLAKAAATGGVAAAGPKLQALTCKGCHDDYRVPKK